MFKKTFLVVLVSFCMLPALAFSQENSDFGSWEYIQLIKSFSPKYYGLLRIEDRTKNNLHDTEVDFGVIGAGMAFTPWLKSDLSYEFWSIKPGMKTDKIVLTAQATMSRDGLVNFIRQKAEWTMPRNVGKDGMVWRTKLQSQYRIPESIFSPYVAYEIFYDKAWIRSLHYVGTEVSIDKHSSLDFFYLYHMRAGACPMHTAGIGYFFRF